MKKTVNEEPVSPEERLAICLFRLGQGDYYHTISQMSGLGIATVCNIVSDVSHAIVESLWAAQVTSIFQAVKKCLLTT